MSWGCPPCCGQGKRADRSSCNEQKRVRVPCTTPVFAIILAYVSIQRDMLYGGSLLFVYAIGHCALIFTAGLSVRPTESIIGSKGVKNFSLHAKKLSGALLVAIGIYFVTT
jgi:cytochrome c-type biogenesis protein